MIHLLTVGTFPVYVTGIHTFIIVRCHTLTVYVVPSITTVTYYQFQFK
jgi:hypothetical protein